ncbi:MAG: hypothetical protein D6744_02920 [Planctomycetota bacterium]|nr:MAG: hypothetical protein D6744_02920 [Planctomycetota bacterium]
MGTTALLVVASLGCAPSSFVRLRAAESDWRMIEFRPEMSREEAWEDLVDTISLKHDIEFMAKEAGYLRTGWMFTHYPSHGDRYRTRVVAKIPPDNDRVRVKVDALWLPPGSAHWRQGSDTDELDDVWGDLQGVIGRVRR